MNTIAFLSPRSGVGTTTLVYHLGWMLAERGLRTLVVDLDPQATLSAQLLGAERLGQLWAEGGASTLWHSLRALQDEHATPAQPAAIQTTPLDGLGLLTSHPALATLEDPLAAAWLAAPAAPTLTRLTAIHRAIHDAAQRMAADVVLLDVGPYPGALSRAALLAAQHLVLSLGADALAQASWPPLGTTVAAWRQRWQDWPDTCACTPLGWVQLQPASAHHRPGTRPQVNLYASPIATPTPPLAQLKHYPSLMPLAHHAGQPMFTLRPANGAVGAHVEAVRDCHGDFLQLARCIAQHLGLNLH